MLKTSEHKQEGVLRLQGSTSRSRVMELHRKEKCVCLCVLGSHDDRIQTAGKDLAGKKDRKAMRRTDDQRSDREMLMMMVINRI